MRNHSCSPKVLTPWNIAGEIAFDVKTLSCTFKPNYKPMKTRMIIFVLIAVFFTSCVRALTPDQAANGSYKKCHPMR